MTLKKISALFPGKFNKIALAKFIRFNNVKFEVIPSNYGEFFTKVRVIDPRFESEVLLVGTQSLYSY